MIALKIFLIFGLVPGALLAQSALPPGVELKADIPFARFDSQDTERVLRLDLYRPDASRAVAQRGVVMWIHGGAWRAGSRKSMPIAKLVLAAIVVLPLWKAAHHVRSLLIDFGGGERDGIVGTVLYLIATVGSGMGVMAVVGL